MRKILVTFADPRLTKSMDRLQRQARAMHVYDDVWALSEHDLDINFKNTFESLLHSGVRGFGYWVWKPQVILQALSRVEDGDIVNYLDVGFHINKKGLARLNQYFDLCATSSSGIVGFQAVLPTPEFDHDGRTIPVWMDKHWAKGDLLDYFGVRANKDILETPTFQAGALFIRKSPRTMLFVQEWLKVFEVNIGLIDDSPSISPNETGFIESRHDQSAFSILAKINSIDAISSSEFWYPKKHSHKGDWNKLARYPLHARRDLNFGFWTNIRNRVVHQWNYRTDFLRKKN